VQPLVLSPKVWTCMPRSALVSWPEMSQETVVSAPSEAWSKVTVPLMLESPRRTATVKHSVSHALSRSPGRALLSKLRGQTMSKMSQCSSHVYYHNLLGTPDATAAITSVTPKWHDHDDDPTLKHAHPRSTSPPLHPITPKHIILTYRL